MAKGRKTGGRNFLPGVVTNPNGRPKKPEDIRILETLTRTQVQHLMLKYLQIPLGEIQFINKTKLPLLEAILLKLLEKAMLGGDHVRLNWVLEQIFGKLPDKIDATIHGDMNINQIIADYTEKVKLKRNE